MITLAIMQLKKLNNRKESEIYGFLRTVLLAHPEKPFLPSAH